MLNKLVATGVWTAATEMSLRWKKNEIMYLNRNSSSKDFLLSQEHPNKSNWNMKIRCSTFILLLKWVGCRESRGGD